MRGLPFRLLLPAALALLSAACALPALFGGGPWVLKNWDFWPGWNDAYGRYETKSGGLYYYLTAKQDDTRDEPSDGYFPGLLLSKELSGTSWTLDLRADSKLPPGCIKRFSYGIWVGGDLARPSIGNASGALKLLVQRQNGPSRAFDTYQLVLLPGGRQVELPKKFKTLRFERSGNVYTVYYSMNRRDFVAALSADASSVDAPSQKFFVGGFSSGDPAGAYMRIASLRLNGREILR